MDITEFIYILANHSIIGVHVFLGFIIVILLQKNLENKSQYVNAVLSLSFSFSRIYQINSKSD